MINRVNSLDDLAKYFDMKAEQALIKIRPTKGDITGNHREAAAWREAADVLRNTIIVTAEQRKPHVQD